MSGNVKYFLDDDSDDFDSTQPVIKTKMKKEDRPLGTKNDLAKFHIQARNSAARRLKEMGVD